MEALTALSESIVEIGRRMYGRNHIAGAGGNISCRLPDGSFLITPSGKAKGRLSPEDMVVIDEGGSVISGKGRPSSEFRLHTYIYSARSDINAIVHAHPIFCTAHASAGKPLTASILPEIVLMIGDIPLAEYGTPSTSELPDSVEKHIEDHDAILLRNHGVVVVGQDIEDAFNKLEIVEHFAEILHAAEAIGGAKPLSNEQIDRLMKVKETMK
jgi:L-fuculose-phosphate aldolase